MNSELPLFPERASTFATHVDALTFYLLSVTVFFTLLIFMLVIVFAIKYRRRTERPMSDRIRTNIPLEIAWMAIPLGLTMVMFVWGARLYFQSYRAPSNAMDVYVVGKQWMWKLQHAEGVAEINELHVPLGRPIRLIMTSQDVIHSFFVPAFRIKQDVLPGRYTTTWFEATRPGEYHLFCAEYCGTKHSGMTGRVVVLEEAGYERWLAGGVSGESLAAGGQRLFQSLGCAACHADEAPLRGPRLENLFGRSVLLRDGRTVLADEAYLRESILDPGAKITAGFEPIMPVYRGQVSEEDLLKLIAYMKSLRSPTKGGTDK
jgi:cytochrome c oxidase subunit 2